MKIVIADDHAGIRRLLKTIVSLSMKGEVEIIECEDGESAVKQYELHQPDLVLMDVEMRAMTGFEASRIILEQDSSAKIIIVTSHNTRTFKQQAKELPAIGFVCKDNLKDLNQLLLNITY